MRRTLKGNPESYEVIHSHHRDTSCLLLLEQEFIPCSVWELLVGEGKRVSLPGGGSFHREIREDPDLFHCKESDNSEHNGLLKLTHHTERYVMSYR